MALDSSKAETNLKNKRERKKKKKKKLSSIGWTGEFCFSDVILFDTTLFISRTSLEFLKLHSYPAISFYVKPPLIGMGVS